MKHPFRRVDPDLRAHLIGLQDANEMARVFLRGRRNMRAAVCFTGYPRVGRKSVSLYGTDGRIRASVPLRDLAAVQRVFTANPPKTSRWFVPRAKLG